MQVPNPAPSPIKLPLKLPGKEQIIAGFIILTFLLLCAQFYFILSLESAVKKQKELPVSISSSLYSSQNASIKGKIMKINGRKMTVENDRKISGDVTLGLVVLINENGNISLATNSAQLNKLKLDKDATINLTLIDEGYVVTSVNY